MRYFRVENKTLEEINGKADKLKRIQQAINFIGEHFTENLYLAAVAGQAFMNPSYFSKFFKETLGISFTDYISK
jgi:YesN/AraC family two-component response regulator